HTSPGRGTWSFSCQPALILEPSHLILRPQHLSPKACIVVHKPPSHV
ncbi:unnamed protein product, partial [Arabidopsis halleri]